MSRQHLTDTETKRMESLLWRLQWATFEIYKGGL